jgi:two-component system, response regulator RegA
MHEDLPLTQDGSLPVDRSLLIVEDEQAYLRRLMQAMQFRGFDVSGTRSVSDAIRLIRNKPPSFAVVELRLGRDNGLSVIAELSRRHPTARAVVITAFDNFTTAVMAIKLGAANYLAKPVDVDRLCSALLTPPAPSTTPIPDFMSPPRVRWEHIQRVYELCDHNVSDTARRLAMHRRTLQRMLAKRAPK